MSPRSRERGHIVAQNESLRCGTDLTFTKVPECQGNNKLHTLLSADTLWLRGFGDTFFRRKTQIPRSVTARDVLYCWPDSSP